MKNVKKLIALGLLIVMMVSMVACGASKSEPAANENAAAAAPGAASVTPDGKTQVNIGWNYAVTSLSPFQAESPAKNALRAGNVWEYMCCLDANGVLHNVLAKDWKMVDEEGYVYEVEMYDYIKDHAGNVIDAEDAIYCIEKIKADGNQSAIFNVLEKIEAIDQFTLKYTLNQNEFGTIEDILCYSLVVDKDAVVASGDDMATTFVGTGPYKVTSFVNSSTLTFEASDYWQKDDSLKNPYATQNVDIVNMVCIPESSQQEVALETGTVDFMYNMPGHTLKQMSELPYISHETLAGVNQYMFYLSAKGVFADERVREAFCYAVDAAAVNIGAYDGVQVLGNPGMANFGDYNTAWENEDYYPYNVEKAKQLLEEAGAVGAHVLIKATGDGVTMQELVHGYLIAAGFDAEIVNLELASYLTDAVNPDAYDVICITPNGNSNIQLWKIVYDQRNWESGTTVNGFKDDELQKLIETAASVDGHTPENMDALYKHIVDKAYIYHPFATGCMSMWRNDTCIKDVEFKYGVSPNFGGFTYTWNN